MIEWVFPTVLIDGQKAWRPDISFNLLFHLKVFSKVVNGDENKKKHDYIFFDHMCIVDFEFIKKGVNSEPKLVLTRLREAVRRKHPK